MVACGNIRDKYLQLICITLNVPVWRNNQERASLPMDPSEHRKDFTERRGDPLRTRPALRHVKGRDSWNKRFKPSLLFLCLLFFPSVLSSFIQRIFPHLTGQTGKQLAERTNGKASSLSLADLNFLSLSFVLLALWTNGLGLACGLNFQVESLPSPILH